MRPNFGVFFFFFFSGAFISPICCAVLGLNYPESQAQAGLDFRKAANWRQVLSLEAVHFTRAQNTGEALGPLCREETDGQTDTPPSLHVLEQGDVTLD